MSERDPESTTIFVGGISYYTNEETLGTVFADCGPIKDIRMPLNEDQSRNRGFAHVEFESPESVDKAMTKAGTELDGRKLRLDYSKSKKRFGGRGGFGGGRGRGGYGGGRGGYGGGRSGGYGG